MLDETGEVAKLEANQREGIWNMGDFQFHALIATLLVTVALGFCLKVPMLVYLKSSEVSYSEMGINYFIDCFTVFVSDA